MQTILKPGMCFHSVDTLGVLRLVKQWRDSDHILMWTFEHKDGSTDYMSARQIGWRLRDGEWWPALPPEVTVARGL